MNVTTAIDSIAAKYFDAMMANRDSLEAYVRRFVKDIDLNVPAHESMATQVAYLEFRRGLLGDISHLSKIEVRSLSHLVIKDTAWHEECSMITQLKIRKFNEMMTVLEEPLKEKFKLCLPNTMPLEYVAQEKPEQASE